MIFRLVCECATPREIIFSPICAFFYPRLHYVHGAKIQHSEKLIRNENSNINSNFHFHITQCLISLGCGYLHYRILCVWTALPISCRGTFFVYMWRGYFFCRSFHTTVLWMLAHFMLAQNGLYLPSILMRFRVHSIKMYWKGRHEENKRWKKKMGARNREKRRKFSSSFPVLFIHVKCYFRSF